MVAGRARPLYDCVGLVTTSVRPSIRYEIKYRIAMEHARALREWLPRHMEPDAHGEGESAQYDVHSLYLDSPDWSIYRDTRNGAFSRFKLRARCYSFEDAAPVFLEVKSRDGEAMRKTRAQVSRPTALAVLEGGLPLAAEDSPAAENFRTWMDRRRAVPKAWVTYRRSAWVGGERGLVRVTFDEAIRTAPATLMLASPSRWYDLPEVIGLVVLEVKYTGSYPQWVAEMIRRFDLERRSMSKYRHAVDVLRALHPSRDALGVSP